MSKQTKSTDRINVLLVEDDIGDVELAEEAVKQGNVAFRFSVVEDGVQAMRFLRRQSPFEKAEQPDMILLDLNLPRKNGREVLSEVKADPDLAQIPVVLLSTSTIQEDIIREFNLERSGCYTKPFRFDEFVEIMRSIERWYRGRVQKKGV